MSPLLHAFAFFWHTLYLLRGRTGTSEINWIAIIIVALILLVILYVARALSLANRPSPPLGHWHHHFENFNYSPHEFYKTIATLVKEKGIPATTFSIISYSEAGIFSMKRDYLHITRNRLVFDICAAPFAKGFFVSWWLVRLPTSREFFIALIPFLGKTSLRNEREQSYFEIDTETMFKDSIHQSVIEAIDALTTEKGMRMLSDTERQIAAAESVI